MDYNKILKELFWDNYLKRLSSNYRKYNQNKKKYLNIYNYLCNIYNDSESDYENIYRIILNIDKRPKCPICGKNLKFIGKPNSKGLYTKTCSQKCSCKFTNNFNKHIDISQSKARKTKLKKYGNENYNNITKIKSTKLEKYGNSGYNNLDKIKKTKLEKYGDMNYINVDKIKQTKLERYGKSNYVNIDKAAQTKLDRYGSMNYINVDKIKQTKLDRYGKSDYLCFGTDEYKKMMIDKYGVDNIMHLNKTKEKIKTTCIEKYNVDSYSKTDIFKEKTYNTKKKNHTFNTSKTEEESYLLLREKYSNVIRQYTDDRYPYNCDFYIPGLDIFIECNYMWTHGGKLYEATEEDNKKLELWKEKNTKFYDSAIKTWTIYDVKKYKTAIKNKLNYLVFYNIKELKEWINEKES